MLQAVAVFGIATIGFGLSTSLLLSLLCLFVLGAADMVSVFVRQTLVQLETPDGMRGRVAAVNTVFIGASNELGEFESGVVAGLIGTVPAVVAGGVGTHAGGRPVGTLVPAAARPGPAGGLSPERASGGLLPTSGRQRYRPERAARPCLASVRQPRGAARGQATARLGEARQLGHGAGEGERPSSPARRPRQSRGQHRQQDQIGGDHRRAAAAPTTACRIQRRVEQQQPGRQPEQQLADAGERGADQQRQPRGRR